MACHGAYRLGVQRTLMVHTLRLVLLPTERRENTLCVFRLQDPFRIPRLSKCRNVQTSSLTKVTGGRGYDNAFYGNGCAVKHRPSCPPLPAPRRPAWRPDNTPRLARLSEHTVHWPWQTWPTLALVLLELHAEREHKPFAVWPRLQRPHVERVRLPSAL